MEASVSFALHNNDNTVINFSPIVASAAVVGCFVLGLSSIAGDNFVMPKSSGQPSYCLMANNTRVWRARDEKDMVFYSSIEATSLPSLQDNINRLNEISLLKDNWNDNGASSFPHSFLNEVRNLIENLYFQPNIFPTARDSIQFEYEKENGDYLELELFLDNRIKVFSYTHTGKSDTKFIEQKFINDIIMEFYG